MTMSMILDILTVLVILLFVLGGYRSGCIKSLVRLIGFAASILGAAIMSVPAAQWLYQNLFEARVSALVAQKVDEAAAIAAATIEEQINAVLASLPEAIRGLMSMYGVDVSQIASHTTGSTDTLAATIMQDVVEPLCVSVLQTVTFLVLFLVLFLVIRLFGKLLHKLFASIPVVKQINGILGAVIGFAEGLLVLFVLCYGIELYMSLTGAQSMIAITDLEQTYLLRHLFELNPILG